MFIVVGILTLLIIFLLMYIVMVQRQLHKINTQLNKRLAEKTRQPISVELFNKHITDLSININKSLKVEEELRLNTIREEKRFKELIANISHDLRTPLTAIKGYQQLMEKENLSKDQYNKLKVAQKYADELGNLIEHFFEYSYLLNAKIEPKLEKININNLVVECLASSINIFEEKNLRVNIEESSPVFIKGDKEMTTRIIQNLINNSAKHSHGDLTIKISSSEKGIISFCNPVINPSEIDVDKLFDRFYTGDKSRHKSTGLGLSIVEFLAKQMDGSAKASIHGRDIEISVELPLFGEAPAV